MSALDTPMNFEIVHKSLIENVLIPNQGNMFHTLPYPMPHLGSEGVLNEQRRKVAVYYAGSKYGGGLTDPFHDVVYNIELTVAADAKGDLLVLNKNFTQPEAQIFRRDALNSLDPAEARCDNLLNELIRIVYQIIMNAANRDLGLEKIDPSPGYPAQGRVITKVEKAEPMRAHENGSLVRMLALMTLECRINETVDGELPVGEIGAGAQFDTSLEINDEVPIAGNFSSTEKP